jgi:hypothetical protein
MLSYNSKHLPVLTGSADKPSTNGPCLGCTRTDRLLSERGVSRSVMCCKTHHGHSVVSISLRRAPQGLQRPLWQQIVFAHLVVDLEE